MVCPSVTLKPGTIAKKSENRAKGVSAVSPIEKISVANDQKSSSVQDPAANSATPSAILFHL